MNDIEFDNNEYDFYVSAFCTTPAPSRTQVKDLIKTMIKEDKIPLLKAVMRKVASSESCLVQRSPLFQAVVKKFGTAISTSGSISIGQDVETQIVVGDNNSGLGKELSGRAEITQNEKLDLGSRSDVLDHDYTGKIPLDPSRVHHVHLVNDIKSGSVEEFQAGLITTEQQEAVNQCHKSIKESRVKNPFYESPTKSNRCSDEAQLKTETSPSGAISNNCFEDHGSNEWTNDWTYSGNVPRSVINDKELMYPKKRFITSKSIREKWVLTRNDSLFPCKLCGKTFISSEAAGNHELKHDITRVKDPKIRIRQIIRNLVTHVNGNDKTICFCKICGKKYLCKQTLVKHIARAHNSKSTVCCPENCGKKLTSTHAIKKHLLSHRPRSEWPVSCPLCGRRFQARADIPKHLKTAMHKDQDLPEVGSADWLALVYWDRPDLLRQKTGNI